MSFSTAWCLFPEKPEIQMESKVNGNQRQGARPFADGKGIKGWMRGESEGKWVVKEKKFKTCDAQVPVCATHMMPCEH